MTAQVFEDRTLDLGPASEHDPRDVVVVHRLAQLARKLKKRFRLGSVAGQTYQSLDRAMVQPFPACFALRAEWKMSVVERHVQQAAAADAWLTDHPPRVRFPGFRAAGWEYRADPARRVVYELDGYPAADAYARALGCTAAELTDDATFSNPVVVKVQGQLYVRSIQKVNADGSLTFYCAVDEGWILDLAGHHEMVPALEQDLAALRSAPPAFMLGFNCILRALEAEKHGLHPDIQRVLERAAAASVSFDTYGEVLNGLHINQTLVALALDDAA